MSMIMNYRRITPQKLVELQADLENDPEAVGNFMYEDEEEDSDDLEQDSDRHVDLDIDKSWHAIHFFLTRDPEGGDPPLANAVIGGTELGGEDVGYGPARYLTTEEVREVAAALNDISAEDLVRRATREELVAADIYPNIWDRGEEELDYVKEYYEMLVRFFNGAAEAGDAMLLYMN